MFIFLFPLAKGNGESWLTGWTYRKSHVVNSATSAGTNYQAPITVFYGSGTDSGSSVYALSHCQTDFDDIRFTDNDGGTLLDYWLQYKTDSANATFWVEVADDLSSSAQTIYMYYGNASVTTTSNGTATFEFFDDFNSGSLDTTKWTLNAGDVTFSSGNLVLSGTTGTRGEIQGKTFLGINHAIVSNTSWSGTILDAAHFCSLWDADQSDYADVYGWGGTNNIGFETSVAGVYYSNTVDILAASSPHIYQVTWTSGQCTCSQDSSVVSTINSDIPTSNLSAAFKEAETAAQNVIVNYVFIRHYVATEPIQGSWGTESTGTTDTVAPAYGSISSNTTSAGNASLISVTISDDTNVDFYKCATNNTGSWINGSLTDVTGTTISASFITTLNSTVGNHISFQFWANDTLNNADYSSIYTLTTTVTNLPLISFDYTIFKNATATYRMNSAGTIDASNTNSATISEEIKIT